jgi:hypothetical protein
MSTIGFAPLTRGEASGFFASGGFGFWQTEPATENQTPRSPSAHDPLIRGSNP